MTGRKTKKLLKKSSFKALNYDFVYRNDIVYSPFDGVYSVPFVIPEEERESITLTNPPQKKYNEFSFLIKAVIYVAVLISAFIPFYKSDITAIELLFNKSNTIQISCFEYNEILLGVDALKAEMLIEERAYTKTKRLIKKVSAPAKEVSKAVSAKPRNATFIWPVKGDFSISSPYGYRDPEISGFGFHGGTDIVKSDGNSTGTPVVAASSGTVIHLAKSYRGYGHQVLIDHGKGVTTRYAHMLPGSISVFIGQRVRQGQRIGKIGSTGNSTGPHLHFEVMINGVKKNPTDFIKSNKYE